MNTDDTDRVRSISWEGSIPIVLTLAPSSLSSPTLPPPIHMMVPRNTYLHIGLRTAILRLYKFAPSTISFSSGVIRKEPEPSGDDEDYDNPHATANGNASTPSSAEVPLPVCWLEDEESLVPLRWQIFAGVLFDMTTAPSRTKHLSMQASSTKSVVPWKLRLHFTSYPSSQLLPLEPGQASTTIERHFKNSLKQALFMQYNNAKVAMNMSKQIHERLWDSIVASNYKLYQQVNADLQVMDGSVVQLIPIRLYVDSKPPLQKPCRDLVSCDSDSPITLGALLTEWLPTLFRQSDDCNVVESTSASCQWLVGGVQPPLSVSIFELWKNLCHPDHFLYIVVVTR